MVGADDEHRVLPQVVAVEGVEHAAQARVALGEQGGVVAAGLVELRARVKVLAVAGPVEQRGVGLAVGVGEQALPLRVAKEGLVRVEELDLQQPVGFGGVAVDEVEPGAHGLGLVVVLVVPQVRAVDPILAAELAVDVLVLDRIGDLADPRVALLPAEELPRVVPRVVVGPAGLEVVVVVRRQVAVDGAIPLAQQVEAVEVEGLHRPPAAVQKAGASRVQVAPRGHAGHGADVAAVERDRPPRQPREVGRAGPRRPVGGEEVAVEAVEHQQDGAHDPLDTGRRRRGQAPAVRGRPNPAAAPIM